jgi:hypothetical protein
VVSDEAGRAGSSVGGTGTTRTTAAPAAGASTSTTSSSTTSPSTASLPPTKVAVPAAPAKREADLEPGRFPELPWGDADLAASLEAVYHWVEGEAIRAASWYLYEKKAKSRWSRALRILAILFATAGAALPFIAANNDVVDFEWGYVLLALAAGAVAMDRYFGFSTAWMRYITAEQAIQRRLQQLQFDWAATLVTRGNRAPSAHEVAAELQKLAAVAAAIGEEIRSETMVWADEFQSNIGELRNLAGRHDG